MQSAARDVEEFHLGAAGSALLTIFGAPLLAGALACALTFLFMWPRNRREGWVRFICAIAMAGSVLDLANDALRLARLDIEASRRGVRPAVGIRP